jgi:hypothetical protein
MWGKAKKPTPAAIQKIAGRILRVGHPLDEQKLRGALRDALYNVDTTVPADAPGDHREIVADRLIDAMGTALQPLFDDLHSLAGYTLGDG